MFKILKNYNVTKKLVAQPEANFGANIKQIKQRMKSIFSIEKITKAMKMVAASKMRIDLGRLDRGKNFGVHTVNTIFANESYLQKKKSPVNVKRTLLVPITSDRGLCGGINSGIIREIKATIVTHRAGYKIFVIGEKGTSALLRPAPDLLYQSVSEINYPINFTVVASIAHQISAASEDCENIVVVYNQFKSAIQSIIKKLELLPRKQFDLQFRYVVRHDVSEPEKDFSKQYFYELYTAGQLYHAMLHNAASEQSARMNAMENASKNAKEILEKLRLNYNKARQGKITQELCEIISGASAV
jgi:F-type H+-transporting ATPase subunit gamma